MADVGRVEGPAEEGDLPESWFNLGVCLDKVGRRAEAASAYRRALALQPAFGEAAANLALSGEPEEPRAAAAYWTDHLRRFPDDAVGRARLAQLAERAGRQDEAWRLARARPPALREGTARRPPLAAAAPRGPADRAAPRPAG